MLAAIVTLATVPLGPSRTNGGPGCRRMSVARRIICWSRIAAFLLTWQAPFPLPRLASDEHRLRNVLNRARATSIERNAVSKPLTGIRVLDMSKVLAGPLCAQYLGDLGADIIKVEAVGQGDETRGWPPFPAPGLGTVFLSANRNKRSIAIDMKTEKGREIVHALTKSADVAIESFGTGVAERLGIDAPTLRSLNDRAGGERPYDRNALFNTQNHDKQSICLDLKSPGGQDLARRLAAKCDVVLANFSPHALTKLESRSSVSASNESTFPISRAADLPR